MSSTLVEYKDLTSYITSLPKAVIEKIFDHPTTCLAIFRQKKAFYKLKKKLYLIINQNRDLPELSKIIVIRLLFLNQEVPQKTVYSWIDSNYQK